MATEIAGNCFIKIRKKGIRLNEKELLEIIKKGECHITEFKKSTTDITKDVYESICAFSNRDGGHINVNKMYPPLFLTPIEYEIIMCGYLWMMKILLEKNKLLYTIPKKLKSKLQKYKTKS